MSEEKRFYINPEEYKRLIEKYQSSKKLIDDRINYWGKKFNEDPKLAGRKECKFFLEELKEFIYFEDLETLKKEQKIKTEIPLAFREKELLDKIKKEIDKDHLEDDNLKMTLFLTAVSSLLQNPKLRMSMQVTGKTAEGKDNALLSTLKHLPSESYLFITSGTQATLEDDVKDKRLLVISEVNLFRENGANKHLLEVIKQRTEGGTSSLKKDLRYNNKEARHEKGEQGSVMFGTTEEEQDEELGTRLMKGTIRATPRRIKIVNDNTLDLFSSMENISSKINEGNSWVKEGLTYFFEKKEQFQIVIPYAKFLKEKIDGQTIFDHSDARSQRDIKRLLSLTASTTYLFQEQREKINFNGISFLVSKPVDLINTLKYSNEFFNQTYSGMDLRISDALKFFNDKEKGLWIDKLDIQEGLKIKHRSTINKYLWILEQEGFIKRSKGVHLNEHLGLKTYKGNHIYYQSVQKAFNKRLISVQLKKLQSFLESKSVQKSVQFDPNIENKGEKQEIYSEISIADNENEHFEMNTSSIDFSKSKMEEALNG